MRARRRGPSGRRVRHAVATGGELTLCRLLAYRPCAVCVPAVTTTRSGRTVDLTTHPGGVQRATTAPPDPTIGNAHCRRPRVIRTARRRLRRRQLVEHEQ